MSDFSIPTSPTNHALPSPRGPGANGDGARGGGELNLRDVEIALQARGVNAALSSLLVKASLEAIARTIEWWDGLNDAGPGVLVAVIRKGGVLERVSLLDQQREYGEQIEAWLTKNFPDLCKIDPRIIAAERKLGDLPLADRLAADTRPHIAARAAVIRLHARHGRGLTVKQHGPEIRAAAKAYDKRALAAYKRMEEQ